MKLAKKERKWEEENQWVFFVCFMIFLITFILQWNDHTAPLMSFFDSKRILPAVTVGLSAKERLEELRKADATYEHNTMISIKQLV